MSLNKISLLLFTVLWGFSAFGQISLMTYNIRYSTPNDKENSWENRKPDVVKLIEYYQPDILGIQEGTYEQVEYLDGSLTGYNYVGVGRDDGKEKGEFSAIFYRNYTYKVLHNYTYWLSETPDRVSVGWDAAMERITTYAVLLNLETKDTLHVFNCHFDHMGQVAREKSSELLISLIKDRGLLGKPLVVMGDLNSMPTDKPIEILRRELEDSYEHSKTAVYGPVGTFNQFDINYKLIGRIDYILTRNLTVHSYRSIDDRRENGLYPSDHLPVLIQVNLE